MAKFVPVVAPGYNGKFVYYVENHCFSRIDELFLDTDPANPIPVKSMEEIGIYGYDVCYQVKRVKKKR